MTILHSHGEQTDLDIWMQIHLPYWRGRQRAYFADIKITEYFQRMIIINDEHYAGKT